VVFYSSDGSESSSGTREWIPDSWNECSSTSSTAWHDRECSPFEYISIIDESNTSGGIDSQFSLEMESDR
jgi:hypothetical protein